MLVTSLLMTSNSIRHQCPFEAKNLVQKMLTNLPELQLVLVFRLAKDHCSCEKLSFNLKSSYLPVFTSFLTIEKLNS